MSGFFLNQAIPDLLEFLFPLSPSLSHSLMFPYCFPSIVIAVFHLQRFYQISPLPLSEYIHLVNKQAMDILYNNNIVYIAPETDNPVLRHCTVLFSLTQTCHYRRKALLKHIAIASCQELIFMDEWTSRHMTILQFSEIRTRDPSTTSPTL